MTADHKLHAFKSRRTSAMVVFVSITLVVMWIGFVHANGQSEGNTVPPPTTPATRSESNTPTLDSDGTLHFSSLSIPFSLLASEEAKRDFMQEVPSGQSFRRQILNLIGGDIHEVTKLEEASDESQARQWFEKWRAKYGVNVTHETLGGVQTNVIKPVAGVAPKNKRRVLINLHGGGMLFGAGRSGEIFSGQLESVPIAALGTIEVVTVDYRQGPEHRFPAATEDVATVYQELLKRHYPPENIGLYGCSAGGMLTAQAVAWFQSNGLPKPGAIGIFGAGALVPEVGDSHYLGELLTGLPAMSAAHEKVLWPYFDVPSLKVYLDSPSPTIAPGLNIKDPRVSPVYSPTILKAFPPSLFISGTRDIGLSPAVYTHAQLIKYGVRADLHVWEGTTHCSFNMPTSDPIAPESREAWSVIVKFFDTYLGR